MAQYSAYCLTKSTKTQFQHKTNSEINEIQNGVYLNLIARYYWISNTQLYLEVTWQPYALGEPYTTNLTSAFNQSKGRLTINGSEKLASQKLSGHTAIDAPFAETLSIPSDTKAVEIAFKYENGDAIVDLTKDYNKIKLLKPNPYNNNVVFNKDGVNELIDNIRKYPVIDTSASNKYGHIKITHGRDNQPVDLSIKGFDKSTADKLLINTNLLPADDAMYDLGSSDLKWKNINSNTVNADTLNGLLTGSGINIKDRFIVDGNGNVKMAGNITGLDSKFICLYHKGVWDASQNAPKLPNESVAKPASGTSSFYEEDVAPASIQKRWHKKLNSNGQDHWKTMTFNGGETWTDPEYFNPHDGATGTWTNENIREALVNLEDGIYQFEGGKFGINASALVSKLAQFGKIDMGVLDPNEKWVENKKWASDNLNLIGGYITFPIPMPFQVDYIKKYNTKEQVDAINNWGWRGRLGYLRGNGNGLLNSDNTLRGTAGLGLVIYTNATFKDLYGATEAMAIASGRGHAGGPAAFVDVASKCHLVLSFLMLTDSGLGLMTSARTNSATAWTFKDYLSVDDDASYVGGDNDKGEFAHYKYRWWIGSNESDGAVPRITRMWLHEDNGGLYWSGRNNGVMTLKPWQWNDNNKTVVQEEVKEDKDVVYD